MKSGDLLEILNEFMYRDLRGLLNRYVDWHSLDINYHPPRVCRVWQQFKDFRVNLHRIDPCTREQALYHPHPWPSVIHIFSGAYIMDVGTKDCVASTIKLVAGSQYEMIDPHGWHSVAPVGHSEPAYSLMLTWAPFPNQVYDHSDFGKDLKLPELSLIDKHSILREINVRMKPR